MGDSKAYQRPDTSEIMVWLVAIASTTPGASSDILRTILTTYAPSMYIPSPEETDLQLEDPPIRSLIVRQPAAKGKSADGKQKLDSPNYVTGIAASLASFVSLLSYPSYA